MILSLSLSKMVTVFHCATWVIFFVFVFFFFLLLRLQTYERHGAPMAGIGFQWVHWFGPRPLPRSTPHLIRKCGVAASPGEQPSPPSPPRGLSRKKKKMSPLSSLPLLPTRRRLRRRRCVRLTFPFPLIQDPLEESTHTHPARSIIRPNLPPSQVEETERDTPKWRPTWPTCRPSGGRLLLGQKEEGRCGVGEEADRIIRTMLSPRSYSS